MKKLLLLLVTLCFIACECPYCGYTNCRCGNGHERYGVYYDYDYFCSNDLLGEWQVCYGCNFGSAEIKDIKFFNNYYCDIIMSNGSDWYTETWRYNYYGSTIKFTRIGGNGSYSFKIDGYIYPELYIKDSFGSYTFRKIKPYSCIN